MKFEKFSHWYDKNYKKILILPAIIFALSVFYLIFFYVQTGDFINKDISLTGGTAFTIQTDIPKETFENEITHIENLEIKSTSDNSGNQISLIFTVEEENAGELESELERILGHELTSENSSKEITSSSLSEEFYRQLIISVTLAFFWMAAIVFITFTKNTKTKLKVILLNILFGFFLGKFALSINIYLSGIIFLLFTVTLIRIYIKNSVPSFAVMFAAFADMIMTLAIVNFIGMDISTAGIIAFLMLIGYSVDTDILLTTRVLGRKESVNEAILGAFKTGITMTLTAIVAISTALTFIFSFGSVLNQIFTILLIGLFFDILNTWTTNASIIKWYVEKK